MEKTRSKVLRNGFVKPLSTLQLFKSRPDSTNKKNKHFFPENPVSYSLFTIDFPQQFSV